MKNIWKRETIVDYTVWDLNCRRVLPHDKKMNNMEKRIKRKNRRKVKQKLDSLKRV